MKRKKINPKERGDSLFEFAITIPLMALLFAAIGGAVWLFWVQAAADIVIARGIREATMNRGVGQIAPSVGVEYYNFQLGYLVGGKSAGQLGPLDLSESGAFRMVRVQIASEVSMSFGEISTFFEFGGGSVGRQHLFFGGPPDQWE